MALISEYRHGKVVSQRNAEKVAADELLTCDELPTCNGRHFRRMPPEEPARRVVLCGAAV